MADTLPWQDVRHATLAGTRVRLAIAELACLVSSVERILQQRQAVLQEIRGRYQPEVEHELDRLQQEVDEVLDANQRARWNMTIENMRSTWIPKLPSGSESRGSIRDDGA